MRADCTRIELAFEGLGRRSVVGRFDGGRRRAAGAGGRPALSGAGDMTPHRLRGPKCLNLRS